jgi:hypothetical protein
MVGLVPPLPVSLFALALPRRLVAMADALLGMFVSICFFFRHLVATVGLSGYKAFLS